MFRAVVFDLWQTLVVVPEETFAGFRVEFSKSLGVPAEKLDEVWGGADFYRRRESGPIAPAISALCETLGVDADIDGVVARRIDLTRDVLVPVAGAVATLSELRRRGVATGLISNCTEEVALVWNESPFAGLFDAAIFSATAGCMKPDRRIYEMALEELGLDGRDCLFVGDGANDELLGAQRVGMTSVLVHPDGEEPRWAGLQEWPGLRVTSIPQVLDLVR